jgi:hypothetical protein
MQAFVLVQTEVGKAAPVAAGIAALDGVRSSEYVVGPYDVIARIAAADADAITALVHEIQQVAYITRTLTCPVADPE